MMKKYLLWKNLLDHPIPSLAVEPVEEDDWAMCSSSSSSSTLLANGDHLHHPSAFSAVVQPVLKALPNPLALYSPLMCLPGVAGCLLDRLRSTKPIPGANERVDLERFRDREPREWTMDDVIAWMLDVARRRRIPLEEVAMTKFASCTGPLLLLMSERQFLDRDPNYGSLLFNEFRRLVTDDSFLDDWMRVYNKEQNNIDTQLDVHCSQPGSSMIGVLLPTSPASTTVMVNNNNNKPTTTTTTTTPSVKYRNRSAMMHSEFEQCNDEHLHHKIRKNKDGKPRKRSQHTKGNKLWEFIRDALKDPTTCPSVVRWEDPVEGVFRIVESEKLARLWGDRKNNQKMTYEKLSRAMRYYYNTRILLPVSGRRLVYKFGPTAEGWRGEMFVSSSRRPLFVDRLLESVVARRTEIDTLDMEEQEEQEEEMEQLLATHRHDDDDVVSVIR